jgi:hypothetical protein
VIRANKQQAVTPKRAAMPHSNSIQLNVVTDKLQGLIYPTVAAVAPNPEQAAAPLPPGMFWTVIHAAHAALREGKSIVVDADAAAARELRAAAFPAIYVFILPPSVATLHAAIQAAYAGPEPDRGAAVKASVAKVQADIDALQEDNGVYDFVIETSGSRGDALGALGECLPGALVASQVRTCFLLRFACSSVSFSLGTPTVRLL